jgi:hypothetical protein
MLLVQILGGLFGLGIAYGMHRYVERKYERIDEALRAKHKIEMEELRKSKLAALRNK